MVSASRIWMPFCLLIIQKSIFPVFKRGKTLLYLTTEQMSTMYSTDIWIFTVFSNNRYWDHVGFTM